MFLIKHGKMQINYLPKNAQVSSNDESKKVNINILKIYYSKHLPALLFVSYLKLAPRDISLVGSLIAVISCFNFKF